MSAVFWSPEHTPVPHQIEWFWELGRWKVSQRACFITIKSLKIDLSLTIMMVILGLLVLLPRDPCGQFFPNGNGFEIDTS